MARQMIDIALDDQGDAAIALGDFASTESTVQHQRQLVLNNKGDFKQNPTSCVGAFDYLDDENYQALTRAMSIEFSKDGMDVKRVLIGANGVVNSDAFYE